MLKKAEKLKETVRNMKELQDMLDELHSALGVSSPDPPKTVNEKCETICHKINSVLDLISNFQNDIKLIHNTITGIRNNIEINNKMAISKDNAEMIQTTNKIIKRLSDIIDNEIFSYEEIFIKKNT